MAANSTDDGVAVQAELETSPNAARLKIVEAVLAIADGDEGELSVTESLIALGGPIAEFLQRDGNIIQKVEAVTALAQLDIPESEYDILKKDVVAAAEAGSKRGSTPSKNKRGTTPAKKSSKKGKGKAKPATPRAEKVEDVVTKVQFEALLVAGLRKYLGDLQQAAVQERRPETIISAADVAKLRALGSPWKQIEQLAGMLGQGDHRANLRSGVEVDFFSHQLFRCFEADIDDLRTAIFLTIMARVLDGAREAGWPSAQDTFAAFRNHFVKYCATGAGGEYDPFTVAQAHTLTQHVSETFFRFYSSFKFTFMVKRDTDSVFEDVFVEEPLAARPLSEAKQRT